MHGHSGAMESISQRIMSDSSEFEHLNLFALEKADQVEFVLSEVKEKAEFLRNVLAATTGRQFSLLEAVWHWARILRHRDMLKQTLRRDVDLYVAIADYFTYLSKIPKKIVLLEHGVLKRLLENASLDFLTGTVNRRFFQQFLIREIGRAQRLNRQFSLALFDVDNFKFINDTYGHQVGDEVLRNISLKLTQMLRAPDVLCRFGGDEFICLFPETNYFYSLAIAERMTNSIRDIPAQLGLMGMLSATCGIAVYPLDGTDAESLIQACDRRLYEAKSEMRAAMHRQLIQEKRAYRRLRTPNSRVIISREGAEGIEGEILDISYEGLATRLVHPLDGLGRYRMELLLRPPFTPARAEADLLYLLHLPDCSYRLGFKFKEINFK